MGAACGTYGGQERCIQGFGWRSEGKGQLARPRRGWEGNIKIDLKEVGWRAMVWIDLAEDRDRWRALVTAVMNLKLA